MRITCPHCGSRGLTEFSQQGDASPLRPDDGAGEAAWVDFVHFRDNPRGEHRELWQHVLGCRTWLVVTRDTATHAILRVEPAADVRGRPRGRT
ncbi:MAG: sarcosine oxidase subunit delta [Geminicoccaceae bacterium]|jgi:sarcosine oxidase subunit delta|nr:sarcosine oxidase subunit delta [Geminicoccaceae bacterium]HRY24255.1 sarcosine oxidase subunit delta [Geminicoccaceae bacterium]